MSSRVLKKLQSGGKRDELMLPANGDTDTDEDDQDVSQENIKHLNPFDLLNQQSFSESEVKEDDNETEHASAATNVQSGGIASKKKKRKRKKKTKNTGNHISSEDNEHTDKYPSDADSLIGKVSDATNQNSKLSIPQITIDKSLLAVELRNLNPQNELRRIFGKRVVKIEPKRGRQKHSLKTTYMITAKDTWPAIVKNIISMKPIPRPESTGSNFSAGEKTQWFAFEHSQYYQSVQNLFLPAVERTDSDILVSIILRLPYHVDSLIQLSELCKVTDDYSLAGELIERAVLILESSLHPSFNLTSGNCRLDYRRQENRSFFIVLFKHAQYLEARACSRTAFELAKLILSFNPEVDPLAMVLVLDYYALRSTQYSWMIKFYEEYDTVRNLSQLPNMAYSYALALFCLQGESENADKALQYALLMFPGALRPLLDELSVQTDRRIMVSSYFDPDSVANSMPALQQLICLYICRAKVIWRQNNILPWLERNVNIVLDRIDSKDDIINDFNLKRAARYCGTPPRPILRHVFLSDFKEKVPLAPFVIDEKDSIMTYDPLPPVDSVNFYDRKSSSSSPTTATNHSISMFIQSILPTFNVNNTVNNENAGNVVGAAAAAGADGVQGNARHVEEVERRIQALALEVQEENGAGAQGGTYRELTQSFTNIVDAIRDFLQNFHSIPEHLPPGELEESGNTEEDTTDYFD